MKKKAKRRKKSDLEKPLVLIIQGSPNKNGRVAEMATSVAVALRQYGAETRLIHLTNYKILPHSGKLNPKIFIERTKDDMPALQRLVLKADGIVFATPTHWFNMSSMMKLFIDRLTSLEHYNFLLEGKVAGFVSYGPQGGAVNALMLLIMFASQMGMVIPPYAAVFDEGRKDQWVKKDLSLLAKNMVQQIKAGKDGEINWGYPGAKYKTSPIELIPKSQLE